MRFYQAPRQEKPVFLSTPIKFVTKRDWRIELAWAVVGTLGTFLATVLILLPL